VDTLSFISSLVHGLAWPTTVIVGVLLLRKPLLDALRTLRRVKYGEIEANFSEQIDKAAGAAERSFPATAGQSRPVLPSEAVAQAEASPRSAILEAWLRLSSSALAALRRKGVPLGEARADYPVAVVEKALRDSKLLPVDQIALLSKLRDIRNQAVHNPIAPTPGQALEYAMVAARLTSALDRIATA
jgi:hypothetical protein